MQERQQTYMVLVLLVVFTIAIGGAYWYSNRSASASTAASSEPVKKFRAKEGTERENVRALVSSVPSVPEETTDAPIDIWGSFESADPEDESIRLKIREAQALDEPGKAIEVLILLLEEESVEASGSGPAYIHALLAGQYARTDPPDLDPAEAAYGKALQLAVGPEAHIFVVHAYAQGLLEGQSFERAAEITEIVGFESYPMNAVLLEVGTIRGIALESLGRADEAQTSYQLVVDVSIGSGGDMSLKASNVFRQASIRLAALYTTQGKSSEAKAVARRVRVLLDR